MPRSRTSDHPGARTGDMWVALGRTFRDLSSNEPAGRGLSPHVGMSWFEDLTSWMQKRLAVFEGRK